MPCTRRDAQSLTPLLVDAPRRPAHSSASASPRPTSSPTSRARRRCRRCATPPGRYRTERARIVIGADGRGSLVAGRVAATTLAAGAHTAAYAYGYWPTAGLDGYHWHYGNGLSAGVIPTNGGLACIFVAGPPAMLARRPARAAGRRASGAAGPVRRRARGSHAGAAGGPGAIFRGQRSRLRRAYGPGWALVGDAGWWMDPLSTHGITDALRDAESLADAVVSGAASARATRTALAGYQSQRDRMASRCTRRRPAGLPCVGSLARPAAAAGAVLAMADEVDDDGDVRSRMPASDRLTQPGP